MLPAAARSTTQQSLLLPNYNMANSARLVTKPTEWQIGWATNTINYGTYAPSATLNAPVSDVSTGVLVIAPGYSNFLELLFTGYNTLDGYGIRIYRWQKLKTAIGASTSTYIPSTALAAELELGDVVAGASDTAYIHPDNDARFAKKIIKTLGDPAAKITSPEANGQIASIVLDCQGASAISIGLDVDGGGTIDVSAATNGNIFWRKI